MTKQHRPPLFVIIACVLCALAFGYMCWYSTLRSGAEPVARDYLFLLLYECLSLFSYLGALWFFARLSHFRGTEIIVVLFFISVVGTTIPYVVSSVQIWVNNQPELASEPTWFLRHKAVAWFFWNIIMLVPMAVTSTVGFLLALPFRKPTRHVAGI